MSNVRPRLDGRRLHGRIVSAGRAVSSETGLRCFWLFFITVAIACWVFR